MELCGKRILVTGSRGFIGKNLLVHLRQRPEVSVSTFDRGDDVSSLPELVSQIDIIIHLAGENRPEDPNAFREANVDLTAALCAAVQDEVSFADRNIPLFLASSTQALQDNAYGRSKLAAEELLRTLAQITRNPCLVFRLPGVFGKWCRPHYNSVVATFCYQIARDLPIQINDPSVTIRLVYVDDVVKSMLTAMSTPPQGLTQVDIAPEYKVTLGELADQIHAFKECRSSLLSDRVGEGFTRALYATYMSYLPEQKFAYPLEQHADARGVFVEMLKTHDSGQFSYFTAHPGITRGEHYHHTKTEKFLVVKGYALFRFRHILTNEMVEIRTSAESPEVVDTIPGWAHDITNVGEDEMIVMLWANENFDRDNPDTVAAEV